MNPSEPQTRGGTQRDLRLWWWTIAVVGFAGSAVLMSRPALASTRPFVFAWLIAFTAVGLYQRRKTLWPQRPPRGAPIDALDEYRNALERRRDQQLRWPARRVPMLVGTVAATLLVGLAGWLIAHRPAIDAFTGPLVITALAFALFVFTRRMTTRAAAAFQHELDRMSETQRRDRD